MLTTTQSDTISGIVCNYEKYVVYNYSEYHDYSVGEPRDSRVIIYVGSDIEADGNTFKFGEDVECYYFTYGKYLDSHNVSSQFTINNSEMVYTNCITKYPDLCYFESQYRNFDTSYFIVAFFAILTVSAAIKIIVGGVFK